MRLPLILLMSLLCALALLASPALAATTIADTADGLTVTGGSGPDQIIISPGDTAGHVKVSDPDTVTVTAPGCTTVDANTAECAVSGTVRVDGGAGDDTFHLADGQTDTVACGAGLDDASDVDAQDTVTVPEDCEETLATAGPPVTTIHGPPAHDADDAATFEFTANEPATFECWLDGEQSTTSCVAGKAFANLADGTHTFHVRATDRVGNAATEHFAWTIDTVLPTVTITSGPPALTRDPSATFAFSADDPADTMECQLDGAGFAPCASATGMYCLALGDGSHTVTVRATDAAGNQGESSYTWTQDTERPQTQLTSGPATSAPVNSATAALTFASSGAAGFDCSLDGGAWQACASPATYSGLANGTHTFSVRAVDAAGNVDGTPSTRTWVVDVDGAPTARISVTRDGDGFALSAAGSADPESGALVYRWLQNGKPAGSTATVHYAVPDHEASDVFTLTVTDPGGQRGQATVTMRTRASTASSTLEADDVIRFASGTRLAPGAKARIAALRTAVASGAARVRLEGHARSGPGAARLSKARAQAVRGLLVKGASPAPKVTVVARGAAGAVASNATSAGRARNDRVVVTVTYAGPAARLITEQDGDSRVSRSNAPQAAAAGAGALKLFAFYSAVPGALKRLEEVGGRVDVLAPNWYTLSPANASISGGTPNAKVMALSKKLGFKVWPVVNATMSGSGLIDTPAGRDKIVTQIAGLAARYRLAGVTLDMEEMLPRQKASYSALVAQLAATLHAKHRKLAIYAVRRTATDVDDGAAAYDWPALARSADLVLASGYNEHSATTAPGPVTTHAGFDALAAYAAQTSRTKVAPTIGAFGYQWSNGAAGRMISSADAERRWPVRAEVGSADGRAQTTGATRTFFESAEDLWAREQAARRAGARWIGLFSLGREPERYWERSLAR